MSLKKADYQYLVNHENPTDFGVDDIVFLKSNSDVPLKVISVNKKTLTCLVIKNCDIYEFPPQCLLQYKWKSLLVYKDKWNFCLN